MVLRIIYKTLTKYKAPLVVGTFKGPIYEKEF